MRKVGVIALWVGLGLAVTDLLALAMERILVTAPMHDLLIANSQVSAQVIARMDLASNMPRRP